MSDPVIPLTNAPHAQRVSSKCRPVKKLLVASLNSITLRKWGDKVAGAGEGEEESQEGHW